MSSAFGEPPCSGVMTSASAEGATGKRTSSPAASASASMRRRRAVRSGLKAPGAYLRGKPALSEKGRSNVTFVTRLLREAGPAAGPLGGGPFGASHRCTKRPSPVGRYRGVTEPLRAAEGRLALLHEGAHALEEVLAPGEGVLELRLQVELPVH